MERYTYRDIIRKYSDDLRAGLCDTDLTRQAQRLTAVCLETASNAGRAAVYYPPTDQTREDVCRAMGTALWDGNVRAFADAVSPATGRTLETAVERASEILRGI